VGALNLAAVRALAAVGNQMGDPGADRRNLLNELFDWLDGSDGTTTVRAGWKQNLDMIVNVRGHNAVGTGMPLGATGPFPPRLRDFLGVATTEWRGLPRSLTLGLVELIAEGLVLCRQIGDSLLRRGDDGAEGLDLLPELFDQCVSVCRRLRIRSHDPSLRWT
jgi:hypothetical protein